MGSDREATPIHLSGPRLPPLPQPRPRPLAQRRPNLLAQVVLFGSAAHNERFDSLAAYERHLADFAARYRRRAPVRARLYWLASAANHVFDDDLECVAERPNHLMSFHRSQLFSAVGAERMRPLVPLLDMWKLTADQWNHSANMHYDELYVKGGLVSHATANLFLNLACNARLLPSSELRAEL